MGLFSKEMHRFPFSGDGNRPKRNFEKPGLGELGSEIVVSIEDDTDGTGELPAGEAPAEAPVLDALPETTERVTHEFRESDESMSHIAPMLLEAARNVAGTLPSEASKSDTSEKELPSVLSRFRNVPAERAKTATRILKGLTLIVSLSAVAPSPSLARGRGGDPFSRGLEGAMRNIGSLIEREIREVPYDVYRAAREGMRQQDRLNEDLRSLAVRYSQKRERILAQYAQGLRRGDDSDILGRRRDEGLFDNALQCKQSFERRVVNLPPGVKPDSRALSFYDTLSRECGRYMEGGASRDSRSSWEDARERVRYSDDPEGSTPTEETEGPLSELERFLSEGE